MRYEVEMNLKAAFALITHPKNHDPLVVEHRASGGLWSLPGGKVEDGETPAEAAIRELGEEVGEVGRIYQMHLLHNGYTKPGKDWPGRVERELYVFHMRVQYPPPDLITGPEGDEVRYVGWNDLVPFYGVNFVNTIKYADINRSALRGIR